MKMKKYVDVIKIVKIFQEKVMVKVIIVYLATKIQNINIY